MDSSPVTPDARPAAGTLLAQLRAAVRVRHYSRRTEEAYTRWVRRYVRFHGMQHPFDLGVKDISRFLTHLAVHRGVSASTQTHPCVQSC